jgi:hypothetical protein
VDAEAFQQRLWAMFPIHLGSGAITLPQLDRVRWILFPEVRVPRKAKLFDDGAQATTRSTLARHHARDGPAAGAIGPQPG